MTMVKDIFDPTNWDALDPKIIDLWGLSIFLLLFIIFWHYL